MTILLLLSLVTAPQNAPAASPPTQTGSARQAYEGIKRNIVRAADKMPAGEFGFQPTPEVRSFGQVLAHIVDANYLLCSPAAGEANPNGQDIQKTEHEKRGRAVMLERLETSFAYCDRVYAALTEANAGDALELLDMKRPRLALLWFHISHASEHYGNLVTYMRIKGIVPPSSEGR